MLSVGTIVSGAFGLVRDRLGAVVVWGLLYALAAFALGYFVMVWMAPMMAMDDSADPAVALGVLGGFFGRMMLLYFAFFVLYTVLLTAAQRAVLRPEESGFASIRLGGDELRQIGLSIVLGILFVVAYAAAVLILGILAALVGVGGGEGAVALTAVIGIIAVLCLMLFLWVRVSLAFPLTLMRRRIVIGEAWRLSRGHFWTMLGGYLALILAIIAVLLVDAVLTQGSYWSQVLSSDLTDPAVQQAMDAQMAAQYSFGPAMLLSLVTGVATGGLMIAFTGGGMASAAKALDADHEGMARTFS